jgi:BRCT domain type II-containing protein
MSLNSKKIAFTGALQMKRKDAEKQAEEAGVTVTAVFTGKNSDVLVCGSGGKKTDDQKQAFYEAQKKAFASVEVWTCVDRRRRRRRRQETRS